MRNKISIILIVLIAKSISTNAQWTAQSSGIAGSIIQSVVFTDGNTGYAVGNFGKIVKTINGI